MNHRSVIALSELCSWMSLFWVSNIPVHFPDLWNKHFRRGFPVSPWPVPCYGISIHNSRLTGNRSASHMINARHAEGMFLSVNDFRELSCRRCLISSHADPISLQAISQLTEVDIFRCFKIASSHSSGNTPRNDPSSCFNHRYSTPL